MVKKLIFEGISCGLKTAIVYNLVMVILLIFIESIALRVLGHEVSSKVVTSTTGCVFIMAHFTLTLVAARCDTYRARRFRVARDCVVALMLVYWVAFFWVST